MVNISEEEIAGSLERYNIKKDIAGMIAFSAVNKAEAGIPA